MKLTMNCYLNFRHVKVVSYRLFNNTFISFQNVNQDLIFLRHILQMLSNLHCYSQKYVKELKLYSCMNLTFSNGEKGPNNTYTHLNTNIY